MIQKFFLILVLFALISCHEKMAVDGKITEDEAQRPLPEGTIARGSLGSYRFAGIPEKNPFRLEAALFLRGQERFAIYCAPCHGLTGDGQGMIVRRGFSPPPTYHQERLRNETDGHFFKVMTEGYGAMSSYADRIPERDRWAIVAYIRALQKSRHASLKDVPPEKRAILLGAQQ